MIGFRQLRYLLLIFALLFVQQGAIAHVLGHFSEHTRQKDGTAPHADSCELCAAFAQLDNALPSTPDIRPPRLHSNRHIADEQVSFVPFTPQAACARAPPVSA